MVYISRYPLPNANVGSIRPGGIGSEEAIAEVNFVGIYREGWSPTGFTNWKLAVNDGLRSTSRVQKYMVWLKCEVNVFSASI